MFKTFGSFDHFKGSNNKGLGFGLVICKKLAGLVGPEEWIYLNTEKNVGSEFSFLIYRNL